jgi:thioester reductase-like protein
MNCSTLVELLRHRSVKAPQKLAYTFLQDGEIEIARLTHAELDRQARALGARLQSLGALGQRVLLLYPPGLEFMVGFFGCLYAGAIAVPMYLPQPNQSLSKLEAIAAACQAKFVLTISALLPDLASRFAASSQLSICDVIASDAIAPELSDSYTEPDIDGQTLALLQYTSGSTGTPKGVMLTHTNILHNLAMLCTAFQTTSETRFVSWMPLTHNSGLIGGALFPLYGNFPTVMMSPLDFLQKPLRWLAAISDYKATLSFAPNFAYELVCAKTTVEQRATLDLSSWVLAICGAEKVYAETIEKFTHTFASCGFRPEAFNPCYGMAESVVFISGQAKLQAPVICTLQSTALNQHQVVIAAAGQANTQTITGCGSTWLEQKILIVHPEQHTHCVAGQVGEIWVSSPSVSSGYWKQPEATQQTFQAYLATGEGPFLRSGDLGFLRDDQLFVTGRLKDLIVIRGRNHYPQDIESTVEKSHPALRPSNGAAFSIEVTNEEQLVVVQEIDDLELANLDIDAIFQGIRQAVSQQHSLQVYAISLLKSGSILKTTSGKIQRQACRLGFLEGHLSVIKQWKQSPASTINVAMTNAATIPDRPTKLLLQQNRKDTQALQTWLISKVAHVLKVSPQSIDVDTSLISYGLDSVQAVSISGELESTLGCRLTASLLWDYPTIGALTQYLTGDFKAPLHEAIDLKKEVILDQSIFAHTRSSEWIEPAAIFLTGATGFLGAFMLSELLERSPQAKIYCLLRADTKALGQQRLQNNLAHYGLWQAAFADRIIPVLGDMSQPLLGLSESVFQEMSEQIDVIYHSAALLNYVYPYAKFKSINVLGTQEILRLACQTKVKAVHYISSVSVFESSAYYGKVVTESDPLDHCSDIHLGYSQSKWVAEKLVMLARDRGLPVSIYRPPFISGHSATGVWNTDDIICRLIKGCIQMGSIGDLDLVLDLSPVDYVSRAIVHLSQQQESLGNDFHLTNPMPIHWNDLFDFIRDLGYLVQRVAYQDWQIQLEDKARYQDNILYPLLPFFLRKWSGEMTVVELYQEARRPQISCQTTVQALKNSAIHCPAISSELLHTYFSYFKTSGFLK